MALQYKIDAQAHEALDESVKSLYTQGDDGSFTLGVTGIPEGEDVSGLKSRNEQLLREAKEAKDRAKALAEQHEREKQEKAKREGDFEQLYTSAQSELEKSRQQYEELLKKNESREISVAAQRIAQDIADGANAEILADFIQRRLVVKDGHISVLDQNGNLTVSTLDQLGKEFAESKRYSSLVRGSEASGGGAAGMNPSTPSKKPHELTGTERSQLLRDDPVKFRELFG